MSALGQKQTFAVQKGMSALPPKADMCGATSDVRFVPIADMHDCCRYSITSSARASTDGGIVRPSAFAVLRLIDQLVLGRRLHRQIGRLLALEDAIDVAGRASVLVDKIRAIGDQAAADDKEAFGVDRRQFVPGRKARRSDCDEPSPTPLAVTIRPPFAVRANAATSRSISAASRTLIGLTSTPTDGATDWMTANWPVPRLWRDPEAPPARVTLGAICLSSSSHFALKLYSN